MMRTLQLTDEEFAALAGLLDAGVKAVGLRAVKDTAALVAAMERAEVVNTPEEDEEND